MNAPIPEYHDFEKTFILTTDYCNSSIQIPINRTKAYGSTNLNHSDCKLSTYYLRHQSSRKNRISEIHCSDNKMIIVGKLTINDHSLWIFK